MTSGGAEQREIVIGVPSDSFPYGFVGEDGEWAGFSVDISEAVARVMNLKYRRVGAPGNELQHRFRNGEFDMLQSLSQSEEREKYAEFSVPYLTLHGGLYVRKRNNPIKSLQDLNGRPFALAGIGSQAEKFLSDRGINARLVYAGSGTDGLKMVESGRCDAMFLSRLTALSVIARDGLTNVEMLGQPFPDYEIRHCFAVHRGDARLLAQLNEGLAVLARSGEYDAIYQRWFGKFESSSVTREQVRRYVGVALGVAFLVSVWGLLRQRSLLRKIAGQTAELAGKEALLQALYDNIPMAMFVFELGPEEPRVLSINRPAAAYLGVSTADARGRGLSELASNAEWAGLLRTLVTNWTDVPPGISTSEHALAGLKRKFVATCVPLAADTAGHARLCVLVEDVTERRRLDDEVAQSRRLRAVGELVGGISHEFNNLLTPVMLKIGEIQFDWPDDSRLQQEMVVIQQAMNRAAELTRRLLTFGRRSASQAEEVRLSVIVANTFALLRQTVDRRILFENTVSADLPPLFFNTTNLHQVFLNLLLNARDTVMEKLENAHGEWKPLIRIEAVKLPADAVEWEGDRVPLGWQRLTVRDNGMGMAPAVRERIFEPFYTTKEVGQGSGLGLATVWHVITEAGGRVEVESTEGVGSAFHVILPMWPAAEKKRPAEPAEESPPMRKLKIFFADDDALVAQALCRALERLGHQVVHMDDGAAAWRHLEERLGHYDLLMFDVNMPGLSGIELARRVREVETYKGKLMIVSGRLTTVERDEILRLQVDVVLNKPFSMDELQNSLYRL